MWEGHWCGSEIGVKTALLFNMRYYSVKLPMVINENNQSKNNRLLIKIYERYSIFVECNCWLNVHKTFTNCNHSDSILFITLIK